MWISKRLSNEEWDDAIVGISTADKRRLSEIKRNKYIVPVSEFKSLESLVERFDRFEIRTKREEEWERPS